jgi:phage terminase small subunit
LSPEAKRWWGEVIDAYDLKAHELLLLQSAAECWDRQQEARATLAKEGSFYRDRYGCPKPHPCTVVERDSRIGFARLVRELGLADDQSAPPARSPHLNSGKIKHFHGHG